MLQKSVAVLAILMFPAISAAQSIEIAPRVGMGTGAGSVTAETGVRLEVSKGMRGAYGRLGVQMFSQGCVDTLPPSCDVPRGTARELAGGISWSLASVSAWSPYVGGGLGVLDWDGRDLFFDAEGGVRRRVGERIVLAGGLHVFVTSSLERPRQGDMPIVRPGGITVFNPFVGVGILLGAR